MLHQLAKEIYTYIFKKEGFIALFKNDPEKSTTSKGLYN